ncbi:MAG: topoisomerase C-terminal repeat-containing protein [Peptococcaceae bacterium]|jgi:hypothetical protein|nr:topoisomerase C-terminal repeat-containing protein [Peptococcaceae bacterium]
MIKAKCPFCNENVSNLPVFYLCEGCGKTKIGKLFCGKPITPDIVEELLTNGRTGILDGFVSKACKRYKAILALKDGKLKLEYLSPVQKEFRIRVESGSFGVALVSVENCFSEFVDYGDVPPRMAEMLGVQTAVNFIWYQVSNVAKTSLHISLSDDCGRLYLSGAREPSRKDHKRALGCLKDSLKRFDAFSLEVYRDSARRSELEKHYRNREFPRGIFPWVEPKIRLAENEVFVTLPDSPDVLCQFKASFNDCRKVGNCEFSIPINKKNTLHAWLYKVRGELKAERSGYVVSY